MVHFDLCQYGRPYRKSTSLMTNMSALDSLARSCTKDHTHTILEGRERVWTGDRWTWQNRTAGAGAYPPALAEAWAELVASVCPPAGAGETSAASQKSFKKFLKLAALKNHERSSDSFDRRSQQHQKHSGARASDAEDARADEEPLAEAARAHRQRQFRFGHE